jgi:Sec-independent protein translocase protein TatA
MEIFGIGPLELVLILLIALIVLGPKEMVETAKKAAGWLRKLRQSETWKTTKEVMEIPNQVLKESGLDKEIRELNTISKRTLANNVWDQNSLSRATNPSDVKFTQEPSEPVTPAQKDKDAEGEKGENDGD